LPEATSTVRDIDFLCVGRMEKFVGIEDIWKTIKEKNEKSKFIIVGRASIEELRNLRNIGIQHMGIVSEDIKNQLYARAKVFLFPSRFEGFGIAITEALSKGLKVVAWKLPVFEERFKDHPPGNLALIDRNNPITFALAALEAIKTGENCDRTLLNTRLLPNYKTQSWEEVSANVLSALKLLA
jgi:glycosyltransferase involved in cell wall biosynthesis